MISSIHIGSAATYSDVTVEPRQINFVYGGNGTGKTTLSRVISGEQDGSYDVTWENGAELETLVFNGEFVERNINEKMKGIFTLGEEDVRAVESIDQLGRKIAELDGDIFTKRGSLGAKEEERNKAFSQFCETCWTQRKAFSEFREVLKGRMSSKVAFANACLTMAGEVASDGSPQREALFEEYARLYGEDLQKQERLGLSALGEIAPPEPCALLAEPITGSADTPVGAFIDYLQNSNWVRQGVRLYPLAKGKCPYCQRDLPANLETEIEAYFDGRYAEGVGTVQAYRDAYATFRERLGGVIGAIWESMPDGYDLNGANAACETLARVLEKNLATIDQKLADPSSTVELDDEAGALAEVGAAFEGIDRQIATNNELFENVADAKADLSRRVWGLILHNIASSRKTYTQLEKGCKEAIASIGQAIASREAEKAAKEAEKRRLEATRTSVTPTVNAINSLLERFGFTGFSLAEDTGHRGMYKIVRPDGTDARKTLSEGEHNFISFLYFYHRVYGSASAEGLDTPRVVVIDDPISSLDSNAMFVVTALAKEIARDCKDDKHGIKQVFILTHNVYFHKEVTFLGNRESWPETKCAYWVISKADNKSSVSAHDKNPISTSYELLWDEIRNLGDKPSKNAFNTMRRILEYYFSVIGGIDYERCIDEFEGDERIACRALVSCINEGSHMIPDDFVIVFAPEAMETCRRVFKEIFYKLGQGAHYEMMMEGSGSIPARP